MVSLHHVEETFWDDNCLQKSTNSVFASRLRRDDTIFGGYGNVYEIAAMFCEFKSGFSVL